MISEKDLVQLVDIGLNSNKQSFILQINRMIKKIKKDSPELADHINQLAHKASFNTRHISSTELPSSIPVDKDSRLHLLIEEYPVQLPIEPQWDFATQNKINQIITEFEMQDKLFKAGIQNTKSMLFYGAPGVGKTLAAKYLAHKLDLPLLILDLATVMSSFLGKTGNNLRAVLNYASQKECILLLDEFDSIAKRRDDLGEVGELKRLVTVLLQAVDEWKSPGILIGATNHPELLDPAAWRRFDLTLEFKIPSDKMLPITIDKFIKPLSIENNWLKILNEFVIGKSYSDIEKIILNIKRETITQDIKIESAIINWIKTSNESLNINEKKGIAKRLLDSKISQRKVSEILNISRDTIRKTL